MDYEEQKKSMNGGSFKAKNVPQGMQIGQPENSE